MQAPLLPIPMPYLSIRLRRRSEDRAVPLLPQQSCSAMLRVGLLRRRSSHEPIRRRLLQKALRRLLLLQLLQARLLKEALEEDEAGVGEEVEVVVGAVLPDVRSHRPPKRWL